MKPKKRKKRKSKCVNPLLAYRRAYFGKGPGSPAFLKAKQECEDAGVSVKERNAALYQGAP
jgi:hypothetical protein